MFAYMEKPTRMEAMFVSSTGLRAEVRRSTMGWLTRSSYGNQTASNTTVPMNKRITGSLLQPHSPPLEMASSKAVSAPVSNTAPTASNLPLVRTADSGTTASTAMMSSTPMMAEIQKMACQPRDS